MKSSLSFSAIWIALLALLAPTAHAIPGVSVGIMGGGNLTLPSATMPAGTELTGTLGYSVGPSVGIGPLEVSMLYSSYGSKVTALGLSQTTTSNFLDIPALYRIGAGPLAVGIGGFYSICLESGCTSSNNNYGATASVRASIPVVGLFVDGRFNLGLKDTNGSKSSALALLVGYDFI
jgi:hypothetical protein